MIQKPPPRKKTDLSHLTIGNMAQERLRCRYGVLQDWKAVAREIGVSSGMAYRVAMTDYDPKDNAIRECLGLPAMAPVSVCPTCGVVHVKKCPQAPKKPRAPRCNRRRALAVRLLGELWG